jgi:hypothetical protein
MTRLESERAPHLPGSSDIALSDFFLFDWLKGERPAFHSTSKQRICNRYDIIY